jgi:hypothetical protein
LNFKRQNEGLSKRTGIGSKNPSQMRRCYPADREALRPEFEELVDLLELIEVLELSVREGSSPVTSRSLKQKKKAA